MEQVEPKPGQMVIDLPEGRRVIIGADGTALVVQGLDVSPLSRIATKLVMEAAKLPRPTKAQRKAFRKRGPEKSGGTKPPDRSWIGRKYGTQEKVDAAIAQFEQRAEHFEAKRDAQPFETPAYWRYHDQAVKFREKARELMPAGS